MNILVIGNGFDIAHNLPTKYEHFLQFIKEYKQYREKEEDSSTLNWYKQMKVLKETNTPVFEEINAMISDNAWLRYFLDVYECRIFEGKENWIDFESEISRIIHILDNIRKEIKKIVESGGGKYELNSYEKEFLLPIIFPETYHPENDVFIESYAIDYLKKTLYDDLNRITRCLEIYLYYVVSQLSCNAISIIEQLDINKVLSFNYTDTYERIYDIANKGIEYDYIHGKVNVDSSVESCNLVLGIDEFLQGDARDNDNEFVRFKKFYQRIYKKTGCKFTDWLESRRTTIRRFPKMNPPELNIYFYGHSLDITDKDILKKLILEDGAKTVVFYHSQEALGNQIANLVKVIGEEELIKRTDGEKQSIKFEKIL